MPPLRCAIIGCGVIAPTHAECYRRLDGVQLAWACDLVEAKARKLADTYDISHVTTDAADVLADNNVDVVSVCTDHASHAPITVAALDSGKHVLCEKALAASTDGLDAMFAAHARHPQLAFGSVFQHRFDPVHRRIKRLIDEGDLGRPLTGSVHLRCLRTPDYYRGDAWRGTWAQEGGAVLINQAIHFIDTLAWLMGPVASLSGTHANLTHGDAMETEDTAVASLRFASGALGSIDATCSSHLRWEPTLEVHGTAGSVEVRGGQAVKVTFADEAAGRRIADELARCVDAPPITGGKSHYGTGHAAQVADFVDAVRDGRPPFVPAAQARHTVEIVLAIYRAHRAGQWVDLPGRDAP